VSFRRALVAAIVAAFASGCSSHRSVLDEGVRLGSSGHVHRVGVAEATTDVRQARAEWEREITSRARAHPRQEFTNLPVPVLRARLAALARLYDFEVTSMQLRRPRQLAPSIVVRTRRYVELARATRVILKHLDPKAHTNDDRTGWRCEGF
jgi:hypothetical protein